MRAASLARAGAQVGGGGKGGWMGWREEDVGILGVAKVAQTLSKSRGTGGVAQALCVALFRGAVCVCVGGGAGR
jgi:hypothetical protein